MENVRFHGCPNLFPSPSPFRQQCYLTFEGLGTLGNYVPSSFEEPMLQAGKIQAELNQVFTMISFCWFVFDNLDVWVALANISIFHAQTLLMDPFPWIPDIHSESFPSPPYF